MTTLQWMDIIYPANSALIACYIVTKIAYVLIVRRGDFVRTKSTHSYETSVLCLDAIVGLCELAAQVFLSFAAGSHPRIDINQYRFMVVVARGSMSVALIASVSAQLLLLAHYLTGGDWSKISPAKCAKLWLRSL